jgi:hypothetical protein
VDVPDETPDLGPAREHADPGAAVVPRWVKVCALVVLVVALLLLAHTLLGGVSHGPSLHSAFPSPLGAALADARTPSA